MTTSVEERLERAEARLAETEERVLAAERRLARAETALDALSAVVDGIERARRRVQQLLMAAGTALATRRAAHRHHDETDSEAA